ncbi:MAG: J domain-containing protein [Ilumatobacteraceae bacterium]
MDPFAVLGLTRDATLEQVRIARRTLAQRLHPDVGGDEAQMQEVNVAFEAAVAHLTGRRLLPTAVSSVFPTAPMSSPSAPRGARRRRVVYRPYQGQRVQHDSPSFTIDALPAEAFEALLVVASWIGEVAVDDPPYLLEARLDEPARCWCRLDLVPDAGATTVSITVVFDAVDVDAVDVRMPDGIDAETVRDTWVSNLNRLGRESP